MTQAYLLMLERTVDNLTDLWDDDAVEAANELAVVDAAVGFGLRDASTDSGAAGCSTNGAYHRVNPH